MSEPDPVPTEAAGEPAPQPPPNPPTPEEQLKAEVIGHLLNSRTNAEVAMGPLIAAEENLIALRARIAAIDAALELHGYVPEGNKAS